MIQLIPLPKKVSQLTGTFRLTQDTSCYFAPELQETFHFFKDLVEKAARFPLQKGNEMADIRFLYDTRIPKSSTLPKLCHNPNEMRGKSRPLFPQFLYCILS